MRIDSLKTEAKRLGLRVTKKVKGKRVPLTEKELSLKIQKRQAPALDIQVRETKKLLRACRSLFKPWMHLFVFLNLKPLLENHLHHFLLDVYQLRLQYHQHHQFHHVP